MAIRQRQNGFSLTEVLLAVGTLAIGMTFIGGTFLVAINFATVSTERTTAAVVANEAFAKVRLYGIDPADPNLFADRQTPFESLWPTLTPGRVAVPPDEFAYPSTRTPIDDKQYFWSALCRRLGTNPTDRLIQVTVFLSRKVSHDATYPGGSTKPVPVRVEVTPVAGAGNENKLLIKNMAEQSFINDGSTIVDDRTGRTYRVIERLASQQDTIVLDGLWQPSPGVPAVWVVPGPVRGGRNPCIAVYQRLIRF